MSEDFSSSFVVLVLPLLCCFAGGGGMVSVNDLSMTAVWSSVFAMMRRVQLPLVLLVTEEPYATKSETGTERK